MAQLLQYNLNASLAPTANDASVTGGTITNGALSSLAFGAAGYASNVLIATPASGSTTAPTAITTNSYFYFTITPIAGQTLNLSNLTFNIARGGASTPRGYVIRSSRDNFAADVASANVQTQRTTFTAVSVDLSAAAFQNLSTSTTFRVYLYAPSTSNSLDIDDLTVNGALGSAPQITQYAYRVRNDDGTEATATWKNNQNVVAAVAKNTVFRLRVGFNSTGNVPSKNLQLEYRKVGDTTYKKV